MVMGHKKEYETKIKMKHLLLMKYKALSSVCNDHKESCLQGFTQVTLTVDERTCTVNTVHSQTHNC